MCGCCVCLKVGWQGVPLFLVVMRDAFVVRNDQLIVLRARLKVEREMKENKLEEEQKRKRGGFH